MDAKALRDLVDRAAIEDVALDHLAFERHAPSAGGIRIVETPRSPSYDIHDERLIARAGLELAGYGGASGDADPRTSDAAAPLFTLSVTVSAHYHVAHVAAEAAGVVLTFVQTSAMLHLRPYLRQLVQDALARAGYAGVILPLAPLPSRSSPAATPPQSEGVEFELVELPRSRLFPYACPWSADLVAVLAAADEQLLLLRSMTRVDEEEAARARRGDPRPVLDREILARLFLVSLVEGVRHLTHFAQDEAIAKRITQLGEDGRRFQDELSALAANCLGPAGPVTKMRNKLGGHIDAAVVRKTLAGPDEEDTLQVWLAAKQPQYTQFDAAHAVLWASWRRMIGELPQTPQDDAAAHHSFFRNLRTWQARFVQLAHVAFDLHRMALPVA